MRQKLIKRIGVLCVSLAVFVATLVSTGLMAAADTFTPSTVTVPSNVTLTVIKNFDDGLQGFTAGNAGNNKDGSVVEHCTTLGYGTSGGSVKWTYDKSKADWSSPNFRDGSETFYDMNGDGYFLWIKAEADGTVRLEGLQNDWATTVHCDAEVKAGENLVYFPYSGFKNNDGSAITKRPTGYHLCLYALTMPNVGTMYVDAFGTYEGDIHGGADTFTPSTVTVPSNVTLTVVKNFDDGLQGFTVGNAGNNKDGSVVEHCTTLGYGTSGGSVKWTYDKSKADWSSPNFRDGSETFYDMNGDGYFLWIKAEADGTVRLEGLQNDWATTVHCDAEVKAGENLVYFPYSGFKNNDGSAITKRPTGYHLCLYALTMPNTGTMYVDAFGTYEADEIVTTTTETPVTTTEAAVTTTETPTTPTTADQPEEHNPNYHKLIDDFNAYADNNNLIEFWTARNAGETGEGAVVTLDTTGENSVSGNSLKIVYDTGKASWTSPGALKTKPDNQDFEGDGFCFWLKTEKAMSMRVSYLTEDAEVVFDIKDIPAGYEGYYHVPFSEVTYFQAGIETEYEDLGFEPMDFYYFSFYVYGVGVYDVCQNTVWFDDLSFYAEESFEPADPTNGSTDPLNTDPTNRDETDPTEGTGTNAGEEPADPVPTGVGLPIAAGVLAAVSAGAVLTAGKRRNRR